MKPLFMYIFLPCALLAQDCTFLQTDLCFANQHLGTPVPSASPTVGGLRAFVSGDALYWIVREDGLQYDLLSNDTLLSNVMPDIQPRAPEFGWSPGWRVGIGTRLDHDAWELKGEWTHIFTYAAQSTQVSPGNGIQNNGVWNDTAGIIEQASTTFMSALWLFHYNQLNAGLSRSFFLGQNFANELVFGVAALWTYQAYNVDAPLSAPASAYYTELLSGANLSPRFTSRYNAAGIFWGTKPQWNFLRDWSVLGQATLYLVHGTFNITQNWYVSQLNGDDLSFSKQFTRSRFGAQGALGLQWQKSSQNDRFHISIRALYEGFIWMKQNLFSQVNSYFAENYERRSDLEMQGLSISTRLDF